MRRKNIVESRLNSFQSAVQSLEDAEILLEMAQEENDEASIKEAMEALTSLRKRTQILETESLFSGEADGNDCFIEIHAGAGGTESCDWAAMLQRMYLRWAELHQFSASIIDEVNGEETGIRSATMQIKGMYAFGWAQAESGVHRLVRISPFDSANRRHTSFASVWVYPVVDDNIEIEIEDKDLRIDTFRSSGAGGQHVNTTDSAIRITHIPTNIVVQCQNERSQHKNRAQAMTMLKARLYEQELRKQQEATNAMNAQKTDNSWGNQIRSYVLHPYQMVKDARTQVETSDTTGVLDGKLDDFMSAFLAQVRRKDGI